MTHRLFRRREIENPCEACQELPSGLPCYDCTFGLQSPPPRYATVKDTDESLQLCPDMPVEDCPDFEVASLAQGVSRIGMAVAMVIDRSQDPGVRQLPNHHLVTRTRCLSEHAVTGGGHSGLVRNSSAPQFQLLDAQAIDSLLPEPPSSPPPSTATEPSTLTEIPSIPSIPEEEHHLLLAAIATITPPIEPSFSVAGDSSPLPCQLLIPE